MRHRLILTATSLVTLVLLACERQAPQSDESIADPPVEVEARMAPDFTLTTIDGEQFTLSEHRGKMMVMDFWATWCKPCIVAMPHMQQLHEDYKDRGVIVAGINVMEFDEDADPEEFVREKGHTYLHLMDGDEVGKLYGLTTSIPVFFIIGFDGEIIDERRGFTEDEVPQIRRILDDYLAARGM